MLKLSIFVTPKIDEFKVDYAIALTKLDMFFTKIQTAKLSCTWRPIKSIYIFLLELNF